MSELSLKFNVPKSKKALSLAMIIIMEMCVCTIYALSVFVGPLQEEHGWSPNMIVMAYSVTMFCEFPAFLIGGWLMARFGTRKVQVTSGVLYGIAILISGLTSNVIVFVAAQGVMAGLMMYGVYICNVALINSIWPDNKGLVMGIMFGANGIGSIVLAPILAFCIKSFAASTVLIGQGIIFAIVLFAATMLVYDPTKGNRELQKKIKEAADEQEMAETLAGKAVDTLPTMRWKKALTHPAFWMSFLSIITIQMIGNVLVTDIAVLSENIYGMDEMESAWVVSAFAVGAGIGGIVIGYISDKIGPYKTTYILGILDGILLLIFAIIGAKSFMIFAIVCIIQGFTYNGMTTLNPIMITDSFNIKDLGTVMGFMGLSYGIVGVIGPQLGLSMPFVPMLILCAVLSIIGGFLAKLACNSLNKYYKNENSNCVVR